MSKPNWDDAPGWASFLSKDEDGHWIFWICHPCIDVDSWTPPWSDSAYQVAYKPNPENPEFHDDWMESLERRP